MKQSSRDYVRWSLNILVTVAAVLVCIFVMPKILVFFMPFVIGWVIASIANPLVRFLENKLNIRRKAGSALVIILVIGLVVLALYLCISSIFTQVRGFVGSLPDMWNGVAAEFSQIGENITQFSEKLPEEQQEQIANMITAISDFSRNILNEISTPTATAVGNFAMSIPSFLIGTVMCLLSSYSFVAEKDAVLSFIKKYVPKSIHEKMLIVYGSLKKAIGGYFVAQFRIEIWIYLLLSIGYLILGVPYAFLIALLTAILDLLPFFGTGFILIPWAVIKLLGADYTMAIGLLIMYGVTQLVRQMIQPKFVGDTIGMRPIPTLFLLYAGYKLSGMWGMILAVPVGIIIVNLYEAGLFDTCINSTRLLLKSINDFRLLRKDETDRVQDHKNEQL